MGAAERAADFIVPDRPSITHPVWIAEHKKDRGRERRRTNTTFACSKPCEYSAPSSPTCWCKLYLEPKREPRSLLWRKIISGDVGASTSGTVLTWSAPSRDEPPTLSASQVAHVLHQPSVFSDERLWIDGPFGICPTDYNLPLSDEQVPGPPLALALPLKPQSSVRSNEQSALCGEHRCQTGGPPGGPNRHIMTWRFLAQMPKL